MFLKKNRVAVQVHFTAITSWKIFNRQLSPFFSISMEPKNNNIFRLQSMMHMSHMICGKFCEGGTGFAEFGNFKPIISEIYRNFVSILCFDIRYQWAECKTNAIIITNVNFQIEGVKEMIMCKTEWNKTCPDWNFRFWV